MEDRNALDMEKPFTFTFLLVTITSACVAFVHGANDGVANAAGPFAAILEGASDKVAARPDVRVVIYMPDLIHTCIICIIYIYNVYNVYNVYNNPARRTVPF